MKVVYENLVSIWKVGFYKLIMWVCHIMLLIIHVNGPWRHQIVEDGEGLHLFYQHLSRKRKEVLLEIVIQEFRDYNDGTKTDDDVMNDKEDSRSIHGPEFEFKIFDVVGERNEGSTGCSRFLEWLHILLACLFLIIEEPVLWIRFMIVVLVLANTFLELNLLILILLHFDGVSQQFIAVVSDYTLL